MPYDYLIDTNQKCIFVTGYGIVTDQNFKSYVHDLKRDPDFDPQFNLFSDLTQVTALKLSIEVIEWNSKNPILGSSSEIVIVAPSDIIYGTSRSFMAFKKPASRNVHLFRDMEEAKEFLHHNLKVSLPK